MTIWVTTSSLSTPCKYAALALFLSMLCSAHDAITIISTLAGVTATRCNSNLNLLTKLPMHFQHCVLRATNGSCRSAALQLDFSAGTVSGCYDAEGKFHPPQLCRALVCLCLQEFQEMI